MLFIFYLLAIAVSARLHWDTTNVNYNTVLKDSRLSTRQTIGCSNADLVAKDVFFGYWKGTKTDSNKQLALQAVQLLKDSLNSFPSRESFKYQNGNIVGYMWVGSMVQNSGFSTGEAMQVLYDEINNNGIPNMLYIEYVDSDPMKTFGVTLNTGGSSKLGDVQRAVRLWSEGNSYNTKTGSKIYSAKNVCYLSYSNRKPIENDSEAGDCDYVLVKQGEPITTTAGVNGESLQGYNPGVDFSQLQAGQPICKSVGNPPNFKPNQNSDGSCYSYTVQSGDTCSSITAKYSPLSQDDLNAYNKNTFQWYGCSNLLANQKICLSTGTPPRPTPNPDAVCGPLAPGDLYNSECPLNACCSEYGYCGTTTDLCATKESTTGAPGTTGCFSNCGIGELPTRKASSFKKATYWLDIDGPLNYDPTNIDPSYNFVHYSFANIGSDFNISMGSGFQDFLKIGSSKIISLGGGGTEDSNSGDIFKTIVSSSSNIETFAKNIAAVISQFNLDGAHFDWEFPSSLAEGQGYSDLIGSVKQKIGDKKVSVAIPATYSTLKNFPLHDLDTHMDYFVLMNYDYYGQWDYGTSGIGCHVDQSITINAIKMLTKTGVDTTKVYGGLANYARTFALTDKSCTSYGCSFSGPSSGAMAGSLTQTPGIMTENELLSIPKSSRTRWTDTNSKCDIMTFNNGQTWGAWSKIEAREDLENWYQSIGLGGSALWLSNYDKSV